MAANLPDIIWCSWRSLAPVDKRVPGDEREVAPERAGAVVPAETHTERGPLDRQGVLELIRDQLADILEIDPSAISESSSFVEDLDADSLALIELVEALE